MKVFISYSRDDAPLFVAALREELRHLGHEVWWDEVSMSNRGRTFLHEIQSAIDAADQVVLVWGETAPRKEYVRFEWQHARDAGKVIVPLVIGVRPETLPEDLRWFHAVVADTRAPTGCFHELGRVLGERPIELAPLVGVPDLPPHYRPRYRELDSIRGLVLGDKVVPEAIAGAARATVLHGMGGVGKSVMAAAFAHSPLARRSLEHGIYWLDTRGGESSREVLLERLAALVGVPGASSDALREVLRARHVGVVVDDGGRQQVDTVLSVLGSHGRVLATTRDASWIEHGVMRLHAVDLLSDTESRELLAGWLGTDIEANPLADELVGLCGGLPLAIALNAGMLVGGWSWRRVIDELHAANLAFASSTAFGSPGESMPTRPSGAGKIRGYGHESIDIALAVSFLAVAELGDDAQQRLTELVAFLPGETVPLAALTRLWAATGKLPPRAAEDLVVRLSLRSLVRVEGAEEQRTVGLHDLVRAFLESRVENRAALNRTLLQAYGPTPALPAVEDDGYVLRSIVRHLLLDGAVAAAHDLLTKTGDDGHNAWFRRLDEAGLMDAFVADVGRLHRQAATARAACPDDAETSELLAREHVYALMTASMATRSTRLGPKLLAAVALAQLPEWSTGRVLAYALTLPHHWDRAAVMAQIWNVLLARDQDRLYRLMLEWVAATPFPGPRANTYAAWLRHLDASAVRFVLRQVAAQPAKSWVDADSMRNSRWAVDVAAATRLAALGAVDEAVDVVIALPEHDSTTSPRREGLQAIAEFLPVDACRRVLEIERMESPESRAWSNAVVAGRLAALGRTDEALTVARSVDPVPDSGLALFHTIDARVDAYRNVLAPEGTWAGSTRVEAEREALALLDGKSDAEWGVSAACIAGVLRAHDSGPLVGQVLNLAPGRMDRTLYARAIAPFLPEAARREALQHWVAASVVPGKTLGREVRWLVPLWPADRLDELTALVGDADPFRERWEFDLAIAARRGGAGPARILRRTVRDRLTIGDADLRRRATAAFGGLGVEPREEGGPTTVSVSECRSRLSTVTELESASQRAEALRLVAPSLPAYWSVVEDDVVELVTGLTPASVRAETALHVAAALAPGQRGELVTLAASSLRPDTRAPEDASPRFPALEAGARVMSRAEVEALESAPWFHHTVVTEGYHAPTNARHIARLAKALDGPEQELVATALLEFSRSLNHSGRVDVAASAIDILPPHARGAAADELGAWARQIEDDPYGRAVALAAAAVADPPAPRWDDVRAALALSDGLDAREQVIIDAWLARHRSPAVFEEVLDAIEGLPRAMDRAKALEAAILSRPPGSWERVLTIVDGIDYPEVELILLHAAITVAAEHILTRCRARVVTALGALDPTTVDREIRAHVTAILPVLEPREAATALGFLWQSLAGHPRDELLNLDASIAVDVRRIDPSLADALAANVDRVMRWWP